MLSACYHIKNILETLNLERTLILNSKLVSQIYPFVFETPQTKEHVGRVVGEGISTVTAHPKIFVATQKANTNEKVMENSCFDVNIFNSSRDWEYEEEDDNISVAGKIEKCYDFWEKDLKASPYVLNILKNGYYLPLKQDPPSFLAKNNSSSLKHKEFVSSSISELLEKGCIEEVSEIPYCSNPLTVAEGEKLRLVLDLRHVNKYLNVTKFKYENLATVAKLFEEGFYFFTFDLKSGYHHVPIAEEHRKYLGFSWKFADGSVKYFQFLVLPFGLASACYAFTKLLRPLVKKWRGKGIRCVLYLDDGISGAYTFNESIKTLYEVLKDLASAGLTINERKSILEPVQTGKWLGFVINTKTMEFSVPEQKIEKLINMIKSVLSSTTTSAKRIAKIAGHIISMGIAIGPLTRLFTRQMYKLIENRLTWYSANELDDLTKSELHFWDKNLKASNGFRIKKGYETTKVVYSDASESGYGGYILQKLGNVMARGTFHTNEKHTSSTYRELLAVKYVLQSFGELLKHEFVQWYSDNMNTHRIIE